MIKVGNFYKIIHWWLMPSQRTFERAMQTCSPNIEKEVRPILSPFVPQFRDQKIAVIVPTIRPDELKQFKEAWFDQFRDHNVTLYVVEDGEKPNVNGMSVKDVMGKYSDLIYNFNDGVRNLGFAKAYQDGHDIFISLDDDTRPDGDTIGDHLSVLGQRFSTSWMNTANEYYMRGFPYKARVESECVFSHGVWNGVADFDASTQLVVGTPQLTYPMMPVPKGVLFPVCVMNVAFKRIVMPYYYQAPMFDDINRFADIWSGIEMKKAVDAMGHCAVTGFSSVIHKRASDPMKNLVKEARGVTMNEDYGRDEYFRLYEKNLKRWREFLNQYSK